MMKDKTFVTVTQPLETYCPHSF